MLLALFDTFSSVCGPASHADVPWFAKVLELLEPFHAPVLVVAPSIGARLIKGLCLLLGPVPGMSLPLLRVLPGAPDPSAPCEVCPLPRPPESVWDPFQVASQSMVRWRPRANGVPN